MTKIIDLVSAIPVFVPGVRLILVSFPLFLLQRNATCVLILMGFQLSFFLSFFFFFFFFFLGVGKACIPNPNNKAPSLKTNKIK